MRYGYQLLAGLADLQRTFVLEPLASPMSYHDFVSTALRVEFTHGAFCWLLFLINLSICFDLLFLVFVSVAFNCWIKNKTNSR